MRKSANGLFVIAVPDLFLVSPFSVKKLKASSSSFSLSASESVLKTSPLRVTGRSCWSVRNLSPCSRIVLRSNMLMLCVWSCSKPAGSGHDLILCLCLPRDCLFFRRITSLSSTDTVASPELWTFSRTRRLSKFCNMTETATDVLLHCQAQLCHSSQLREQTIPPSHWRNILILTPRRLKCPNKEPGAASLLISAQHSLYMALLPSQLPDQNCFVPAQLRFLLLTAGIVGALIAQSSVTQQSNYSERALEYLVKYTRHQSYYRYANSLSTET